MLQQPTHEGRPIILGLRGSSGLATRDQEQFRAAALSTARNHLKGCRLETEAEAVLLSGLENLLANHARRIERVLEELRVSLEMLRGLSEFLILAWVNEFATPVLVAGALEVSDDPAKAKQLERDVRDARKMAERYRDHPGIPALFEEAASRLSAYAYPKRPPGADRAPTTRLERGLNEYLYRVPWEGYERSTLIADLLGAFGWEVDTLRVNQRLDKAMRAKANRN